MHRWIEHTGELALEIAAEDEDAIFGEALAAMAELLGEDLDDAATGMRDPPAASAGVRHEIELEGRDRARLLAAFLAELAFLAETEGFIAHAFERLAREEARLTATVRGRTGDPPHLVKAVTYHRLTFAPAAGGWRATVVLDV